MQNPKIELSVAQIHSLSKNGGLEHIVSMFLEEGSLPEDFQSQINLRFQNDGQKPHFKELKTTISNQFGSEFFNNFLREIIQNAVDAILKSHDLEGWQIGQFARGSKGVLLNTPKGSTVRIQHTKNQTIHNLTLKKVSNQALGTKVTASKTELREPTRNRSTTVELELPDTIKLSEHLQAIENGILSFEFFPFVPIQVHIHLEKSSQPYQVNQTSFQRFLENQQNYQKQNPNFQNLSIDSRVEVHIFPDKIQVINTVPDSATEFVPISLFRGDKPPEIKKTPIQPAIQILQDKKDIFWLQRGVKITSQSFENLISKSQTIIPESVVGVAIELSSEAVKIDQTRSNLSLHSQAAKEIKSVVTEFLEESKPLSEKIIFLNSLSIVVRENQDLASLSLFLMNEFSKITRNYDGLMLPNTQEFSKVIPKDFELWKNYLLVDPMLCHQFTPDKIPGTFKVNDSDLIKQNSIPRIYALPFHPEALPMIEDFTKLYEQVRNLKLQTITLDQIIPFIELEKDRITGRQVWFYQEMWQIFEQTAAKLISLAQNPPDQGDESNQYQEQIEDQSYQYTILKSLFEIILSPNTGYETNRAELITFYSAKELIDTHTQISSQSREIVVSQENVNDLETRTSQILARIHQTRDEILNSQNWDPSIKTGFKKLVDNIIENLSVVNLVEGSLMFSTIAGRLGLLQVFSLQVGDFEVSFSYNQNCLDYTLATPNDFCCSVDFDYNLNETYKPELSRLFDLFFNFDDFAEDKNNPDVTERDLRDISNKLNILQNYINRLIPNIKFSSELNLYILEIRNYIENTYRDELGQMKLNFDNEISFNENFDHLVAEDSTFESLSKKVTDNVQWFLENWLPAFSAIKIPDLLSKIQDLRLVSDANDHGHRQRFYKWVDGKGHKYYSFGDKVISDLDPKYKEVIRELDQNHEENQPRQEEVVTDFGDSQELLTVKLHNLIESYWTYLEISLPSLEETWRLSLDEILSICNIQSSSSIPKFFHIANFSSTGYHLQFTFKNGKKNYLQDIFLTRESLVRFSKTRELKDLQFIPTFHLEISDANSLQHYYGVHYIVTRKKDHLIVIDTLFLSEAFINTYDQSRNNDYNLSVLETVPPNLHDYYQPLFNRLTTFLEKVYPGESTGILNMEIDDFLKSAPSDLEIMENSREKIAQTERVITHLEKYLDFRGNNLFQLLTNIIANNNRPRFGKPKNDNYILNEFYFSNFIYQTLSFLPTNLDVLEKKLQEFDEHIDQLSPEEQAIALHVLLYQVDSARKDNLTNLIKAVTHLLVCYPHEDIGASFLGSLFSFKISDQDHLPILAHNLLPIFQKNDAKVLEQIIPVLRKVTHSNCHSGANFDLEELKQSLPFQDYLVFESLLSPQGLNLGIETAPPHLLTSHKYPAYQEKFSYKKGNSKPTLGEFLSLQKSQSPTELQQNPNFQKPFLKQASLLDQQINELIKIQNADIGYIIRELLQNAIDAFTQNNTQNPQINLGYKLIQIKGKTHLYLTFEDNGPGCGSESNSSTNQKASGLRAMLWPHGVSKEGRSNQIGYFGAGLKSVFILPGMHCITNKTETSFERIILESSADQDGKHIPKVSNLEVTPNSNSTTGVKVEMVLPVDSEPPLLVIAKAIQSLTTNSLFQHNLAININGQPISIPRPIALINQRFQAHDADQPRHPVHLEENSPQNPPLNIQLFKDPQNPYLPSNSLFYQNLFLKNLDLSKLPRFLQPYCQDKAFNTSFLYAHNPKLLSPLVTTRNDFRQGKQQSLESQVYTAISISLLKHLAYSLLFDEQLHLQLPQDFFQKPGYGFNNINSRLKNLARTINESSVNLPEMEQQFKEIQDLIHHNPDMLWDLVCAIRFDFPEPFGVTSIWEMKQRYQNILKICNNQKLSFQDLTTENKEFLTQLEQTAFGKHRSLLQTIYFQEAVKARERMINRDRGRNVDQENLSDVERQHLQQFERLANSVLELITFHPSFSELEGKPVEFKQEHDYYQDSTTPVAANWVTNKTTDEKSVVIETFWSWYLPTILQKMKLPKDQQIKQVLDLVIHEQSHNWFETLNPSGIDGPQIGKDTDPNNATAYRKTHNQAFIETMRILAHHTIAGFRHPNE